MKKPCSVQTPHHHHKANISSHFIVLTPPIILPRHASSIADG